MPIPRRILHPTLPRLLPGLALACVLLAGCGPGGELETRTFPLRSLLPHQAEELVAPYVYFDRETAPGQMSVTEGALTVRETADNLDRIADVLEDFDRPTSELRLHFQVIEADGYAGTDPAITDVEAQLRELFRFEGYRLVGEGVVAVSHGADFQQRLLGREGEWMVSGEVLRTGSAAVRLHQVQLWSGVPIFRTSLNVHPGRTVVMGSARTQDEGGAVILTVRAEEVPGSSAGDGSG